VRFYARSSKSGLLEDRTAEIEAAQKAANTVTQDQADKLFGEVEKRWNREAPFSTSANTGDRYVVSWAAERLGLHKRYAKQLIDNWMDDGYLAIEQLNAHTKKRGLCVVQRPQIERVQERGYVDD
jgi:S-formylglutathione hydrolase FrmB